MSNTQTTIVLEPTTDAAASEEFIVGYSEGITVTCVGLAGSETAQVQFKDPIDNTWHDLSQSGVLIKYTSTIQSIDVWNTGGIFRLNKDATVAEVGVAVTRYLTN